MKVQLTYIKDNQRTSVKTGKPYTSRSIKTQEYGEQWLSGFANASNKGWKVGDTVEIEVKEVKKDDKTFLNFEVPKPEDKVGEKLEQVLNYLVGVKIDLQIIKEHIVPKKKGHSQVDYPTAASEGIDLNNIFPEPTEEELHQALD